MHLSNKCLHLFIVCVQTPIVQCVDGGYRISCESQLTSSTMRVRGPQGSNSGTRGG